MVIYAVNPENGSLEPAVRPPILSMDNNGLKSLLMRFEAHAEKRPIDQARMNYIASFLIARLAGIPYSDLLAAMWTYEHDSFQDNPARFLEERAERLDILVADYLRQKNESAERGA
jgi:hypothetical protein